VICYYTILVVLLSGSKGSSTCKPNYCTRCKYSKFIGSSYVLPSLLRARFRCICMFYSLDLFFVSSRVSSSCWCCGGVVVEGTARRTARRVGVGVGVGAFGREFLLVERGSPQ